MKHKSVCLLPHATTSFSNFFQAWVIQPTELRRQVSKLYHMLWSGSFYASFSQNFILGKYKLKEAIAGIQYCTWRTLTNTQIQALKCSLVALFQKDKHITVVPKILDLQTPCTPNIQIQYSDGTQGLSVL